MQTKKKLRAELEKTERAFCDMNDQVMSLQKQLSDTIVANGVLKHDLSTAKKQSGKLQQLLDEARAESEKLRGELAETERKLNNAEWREKHFRAGNNAKPAEEPAETEEENYIELTDTSSYSEDEIHTLFRQKATRILDHGGFVPCDKNGNVFDKAYILCLLTDEGSKTNASGSLAEYKTLLSGLFAAARESKELKMALAFAQLLDMLHSRLTSDDKDEPQEEGDAE